VIVISVLLVLMAGILLGLGLVYLDAPLLYASIGISALAALALVVGVRRLAALRAGQGLITVRPAGASRLGRGTARQAQPDLSVRPASATGRASPRPVGRATPRPMGRAAVGAVVQPDLTEDDPAEESLGEREVARVASLNSEVVVVDGQPRYHLADCPDVANESAEPSAAGVASQSDAESDAQLASFAAESDARLASFAAESDAQLASFTAESDARLASFAEVMPVAEAVELGFTPCGRCRPASALLRAAGEE
jgi:hypothetical protein